MATNRNLTIGIDAGENTGVAVYDSLQKKITGTKTTDFFGVVPFLRQFDKEQIKIFVEVPSDFVYERNERQSGKVRDRMCFNIGGNRREAMLLARKLKLLGYAVKEVLPVRAKKWTAEQIKRYLGIDERCSQHVRDAARLAFFHSSVNI